MGDRRLVDKGHLDRSGNEKRKSREKKTRQIY